MSYSSFIVTIDVNSNFIFFKRSSCTNQICEIIYILCFIFRNFKHIYLFTYSCFRSNDRYTRNYKCGFALVATALLLFFSDYASRPGRTSIFPANTYRNGISYWQAFAVGLGQAFAVIPGLSRSGTTISTGLICGVKREVMAQFSFLMVLVPILGETFLELVGGEFGASSVGVLPLVLGFVSAFLSGLFACKVMIALVKKAKLSWFALYCLLAAAAIFIFA